MDIEEITEGSGLFLSTKISTKSIEEENNALSETFKFEGFENIF